MRTAETMFFKIGQKQCEELFLLLFWTLQDWPPNKVLVFSLRPHFEKYWKVNEWFNKIIVCIVLIYRNSLNFNMIDQMLSSDNTIGQTASQITINTYIFFLLHNCSGPWSFDATHFQLNPGQVQRWVHKQMSGTKISAEFKRIRRAEKQVCSVACTQES